MSSVDLVLLVAGTLAFLAVGSFVCVVVDRLPLALDEPNEYGELWDTRPWSEVFGGHSRCSSCGEPIRPQDNIPVLSWLLLRGRCRGCEARIPGFHPVIELMMPLLFLASVWSLGWNLTLLPLLWLLPVGVAIGAIDLRTLIVPTRIVWPAVGVAVVLTAVVAGAEGEWGWLLTALVGMLAVAGPLFVLWFALPSAMGFGDVRLCVLLGWTIGFYAGTRPIAGVILAIICLAMASAIGLVVGVVALGARGRKAQVPFGPSLVAAAVLCIWFVQPILEPFGVYVS